MRNKQKLYHIQTYGCQMNEHDSEVLAGILEEMGYYKADDASEADVILVNTCCVRESAEQRILGEVGRLKQHKYRNPDLLLGVCGCMVMTDDSMEKIRRRTPHVDFIVGTNQLHRLPEFIERAAAQKEMLVQREDPDEASIPAGLPRRRVDGVRAWVPIVYGCNNFCTYCIVPHVRGREISRPMDDVVEEVETLAGAGITEITLLGQNVNSYGKDLDGEIAFADLLRAVDAVEGIRWVRFTTSHPRDFDTDLVDLVVNLEHVCEHFHLPVQSGSDRILKRMNRGYSRDQYLDLVRHIGDVAPEASVTTDVIVGFPGETEEDFAATYDLFSRVRFDNAFSFIYSPRSGTEAASYGDQVPHEVKLDRLQRLNDLQKDIALEKNLRLQGEEVTLLVDGPSERDPSIYRARSRTNKLVLLPEAEGYCGQYVRARIDRAETFQLRATLIESVGN